MSAIEALSFSPSQAAKFLGVGRTKMLALLQSGRIEARTLDGRIRVDAASVDAFYKTLPAYRVEATRQTVAPAVAPPKAKRKAKRKTVTDKNSQRAAVAPAQASAAI